MLFKNPTVLYSPDGDGGGGTPPPSATEGSTASNGSTEDRVPYKRFKSVLDELEGLKAQVKQAEDASKARQEQELAEQKKFQELAEQYKRELEAERTSRLRLEVAGKAGLPVEFASRLQGDDEASMTKDAESLKAFLKPASPGTPPAPTRTELAQFTAEQLNDPKWVRENQAKIMAANA